MLSETEKQQIEAAVAMYETRSAAAVEGMRILQGSRGWVSDEALSDLASLLDVSTSMLESLATFYSMIFRRVVGRHVIMVCSSVCCWMQGGEAVVRYLSAKLGIEPGDTTPDGRFTLLPVVCIGACEQAPAMLIDWDLHGDLSPAKIDSTLTLYV